MNKYQLSFASCAVVFSACLSTPSLADFGFGDELDIETLQARNWIPSTNESDPPDTGTWVEADCPGNSCSNFIDAEAVYVPDLDITWWRFASGSWGPDVDQSEFYPNGNSNGPYNAPMTKTEADNYIANLNSMNDGNGAYGINTWRLPKIEPRVVRDDGSYDLNYTQCDIRNSGADIGYWNDSPNSELSYLYYVALGAKPNFNVCNSSGNDGLFWSTVAQAFRAIQSSPVSTTPFYWSGSTAVVDEEDASLLFSFTNNYLNGLQTSSTDTDLVAWVWAVTDGDVAQTPIEKLAELIENVMLTNKSKGLLNSLDAKFNSAIQALDDANAKNDIAAVNNLYAFIYSVEAQRGHLITEEDADELINAAQAIIDSLGGS